MLPVIALIGRPNVGKSTLFNRLTGRRDALVAALPGLTRDRLYGRAQLEEKPFIVVDTGGLTGNREGLEALMAAQAQLAIREADAIIFLVDGREGLTAGDEEIARALRVTGKTIWLAVNKTEGYDSHIIGAEFQALGLGHPWTISSAHGQGVGQLLEAVLAPFPPPPLAVPQDPDAGICITVVGRPNVGKSTLINRLVGEERVLAFDQPGTTRDAVHVPFEHAGSAYTLIDTAGVRRRGRVDEMIEKFSVVKTLQALEQAHVVILVVDAREGITDQDAHLSGLIVDSGRAVVIAINKWDGLPFAQRERVKAELALKLPFLTFAKMFYISALQGTGVEPMFAAARRAYECAFRQFSTPDLARLLETAVVQHQPPLVRGRRIKLRYAHQGGRNPPRIIVHGNQVEAVPDAYRRYLAHYFAEHLELEGTPLVVEFKGSTNPYQGKKNTLTARQIRKKQRLRKFVGR